MRGDVRGLLSLSGTRNPLANLVDRRLSSASQNPQASIRSRELCDRSMQLVELRVREFFDRRTLDADQQLSFVAAERWDMQHQSRLSLPVEQHLLVHPLRVQCVRHLGRISR